MSNSIYVVTICLILLGISFTLIKFIINIYLSLSYKKHKIEPVSAKLQKKKITFSIHIPTRAEPFHVVKDCIDSLLLQINPEDEIIVIDNNHTSEKHYRPLEAYCKEKHIHFEHHDYIPGYKAGALNVALSQTSEHASHILIVDCDYILSTDALDRIKSICEHASAYGFVQFPQAYLVNPKQDIENELNKYFLYNLKINQYKALGTGTLCCVPKEDLIQIQGWPTQSITEDALFGLRIQDLGKTGLYVHEVVGRGYLPQTIRDYFNQRKRWIYGNAQVLFIIIYKGQTQHLTTNNLSQLSTWLNFASLTVCIHIVLLCFSLFGKDIHNLLYWVYAHYILIFIMKVYEFYKLHLSVSRRVRAFLIQWQFLWIASFHWLPVLFNQPKEFIRTPKISRLKLNFWNVPLGFFFLNLVTSILYFNNIYLIFSSIFFLIAELAGKIILISNFKK